MNYEKKYKEALERMKSWAKGEHPECFSEAQKTAEFIFPELKENEDKRIRKGLIKAVSRIFEGHKLFDTDVTREEALAWLEKQGETFNTDITNRSDEMLHAISTGLTDVGVELGWSDFGGIPIEEIKDWLEKQGEQKPYGQRKECEDCQSNYAGECKGFCQMERDEQKPIDKVESKFHEGEWIIHQGTENIYQVVACIDNQYQLKYGDNYTVQKCTDVDRCARLWTIADAKDGDVLVTTAIRNCPFIYRKTDYNNNLAYYYAGIDGSGDFCEGCIKRTLYHFGPLSNVVPATKEQRDLLFQKMKEAGYKWDSEKNELKKVEQGNHPRIVMADFTGGEGFYKLNLDNLNEEQVFAIEIMINNPKPGKKIDADKAIAWLVVNICDFEYYVKRFKKDFGL